MTGYTDAQKRATQKYREKNKLAYIQLVLPSEKKEEIKAFATSKGKSTSEFILDLIDKAMSSDQTE